MEEEEDDDCNNLFLHPLVLLQDPSWGGRLSSSRLQIILIPRTVPRPPGNNSHANSLRARSSSTQTEGNAAHPSPRQRQAKSFAVTTTLAGRSCITCGDNYQRPQRVTRGTGRTRDRTVPGASDRAVTGPVSLGDPWGPEEGCGWIENWLNGRAQRAVISSAESGWRPVASGVPRGQYWAQSCSTYSLMTWMKRLSVPSASLLVTQNWEEWWIHRKAVLPFSETWRGWRVGHRGT